MGVALCKLPLDSSTDEARKEAKDLGFEFVLRRSTRNTDVWTSYIKHRENGKIVTEKQEVHGEFIGMMKLTHSGAEIFKQNFHRVKKLYWNKPFQRAKIFQQAYLTDMIQELVDIGIKVHCVIIERGWKEIDTVEDYQKALQEFKH